MSGIRRTSRSSTERVASAKDRYDAAEAAAAALIAPDSIVPIIGHGGANAERPLLPVMRRRMRLATFLAPGAGDPRAGEVRGDDVVAFAVRHACSTGSPRGDRTPAGGEAFAARRRRRCSRRCRGRGRSSASA